jgi:hypothetical protein
MLCVAWGFALLNVEFWLSTVWDTPPPDFMIYYFGGRLAAEGKISQLYQKPAYESLISELRASGVHFDPTSEAIGSFHFVRPAFAAYLYVPFTWFPYRTSAMLGVVANLIFMGVLIWKLPLWFPHRDFLGTGLFRACLLLFAPFSVAIVFGQDILLLTLLAAAGVHLILEDREVPGGVLLGLCAFKPHLIVMMPLALLAAGKRRALAAFAGTVSALALLSFALVGPEGVRDWLAILRNPSVDFAPEGMGNLRATALVFGPAVGIAAGLLALLCLALIFRRGTTHDRISAGILGALLLSPHVYRYDFAVLLIVCVLAQRLALRYAALLPWMSLYPVAALQPYVMLSLGYLAVMATDALRRPVRPEEAASRAALRSA